MQWWWELGGAGTYYWGQPIQQCPGTHLHSIFFSLITPISLAQCTSSPACPDLYTLYTLFLSFLCVKSCVYEVQSHFGHEAMLTADIASPRSWFLLGWMNRAPAEWQLLCTNQHGPVSLEEFNLFQHCCDNLKWQPSKCTFTNTHNHMLFTSDMTPPWPSSGTLVTWIQIMHNNRTKMYDKTTQYYTQFFITNLMITKHEYFIIS